MTTQTDSESFDTIVIGGGPAGSSTAAMLGEKGRRVLLLEREKFPRYHIGESLIPFTFGPLEKLGIIPKMRASCFTKKYSVSFVQPDGHQSQPFYFFDRYDRDTIAQTWQVTRADFDQLLLDHARERGVVVREESTVQKLLMDGDKVLGVQVTEKSGRTYEARAPITVDATGKEAFTSRQRGWRMNDPYLNKIAIWTYYHGSKRSKGIDEGATTIAFVPEKGWFWHIPLHDDRVSVGIVAEGKYLTRDGLKEPRAMFERELHSNQWIKERLSTGTCSGEFWVTSEYSRHSRFCASPGLVLVGDAFAFLDPVFSSGVMLALKSGVLAAETIHEGLLAQDLSPSRFETYGKTMREGVENMRKLVYAFYDVNFSFKDVVMRHPEAAHLITDCLSGDVNRDFSVLWDWIREFSPLPETLPYGAPLSGAA
jgi:flavin-dependent dehydrogenase